MQHRLQDTNASTLVRGIERNVSAEKRRAYFPSNNTTSSIVTIVVVTVFVVVVTVAKSVIQ